MKFTTLIPMRFNDGREVPLAQINRIIDALAAQFNGCSDEGVTKGQWLDPKDSRLYRDESQPDHRRLQQRSVARSGARGDQDRPGAWAECDVLRGPRLRWRTVSEGA